MVSYPNHTYFIPHEKIICGKYKDDYDVKLLLYAFAMKFFSNKDILPFDGVSIFSPENIKRSVIRVISGLKIEGDINYQISDFDCDGNKK